MNSTSLGKAALLAFLLLTITLVSWEWYNRTQQYDTNFDDGGPLWAHTRKQVYGSQEEKTVFIGSSRIKFDLDIPLWESLTGTKAIQLSCVGSTPLPILHDLAMDEKFAGRLVIDVTEILFFSDAPPNMERPTENLHYYKEETPAQKASFQINRFLESNLVFLDKDRLSLNAKLAKLRIPNRPGVFEFPLFPDGFGRVKFDRQEYLTDQFMADSNQQNQTKGVWGFLAEIGKKQPPPSPGKIDTLFGNVKADIDKIKARGGRIFFVRTPSTGPFFMGESMAFPRDKFFDRILQTTGSPGFHFLDSPATKDLQCPEFSHLSMADAKVFTRELVRVMQSDPAWQFNNSKPN
jgi:hypothetical protein